MDEQNLELYKENRLKAVITDIEVMGNENNLYFQRNPSNFRRLKSQAFFPFFSSKNAIWNLFTKRLFVFIHVVYVKSTLFFVDNVNNFVHKFIFPRFLDFEIVDNLFATFYGNYPHPSKFAKVCANCYFSFIFRQTQFIFTKLT